MNPILQFDTKQVEAALARINLNVEDFKSIEKRGADVLVEGMQNRAAVDTGDMKNSVKQHIVEASMEKIEDDVGPEAPYAIYQEFGTGIYAEAGNGRKTSWRYVDRNGNWHTTQGNKPHPFVRPTAIEDRDKVIDAMHNGAKLLIEAKWQR